MAGAGRYHGDCPDRVAPAIRRLACAALFALASPGAGAAGPQDLSICLDAQPTLQGGRHFFQPAQHFLTVGDSVVTHLTFRRETTPT